MCEEEVVIEQAHCNGCGQQTRHYVRGLFRGTGVFEQEVRYEILECCGCSDVVFRRSGDVLVGHGEVSDHEYFPPIEARPLPSWFYQLPREVSELLGQTYTALDAHIPALAAMGARAVLDVVMTDKVGDCGGFGDKLKEMLKRHLINSDEKDLLQAALDTGHAAMHRGHVPSAKELRTVMDILEHVLKAIYILPTAAAELRKTTPARGARSGGRQDAGATPITDTPS